MQSHENCASLIEIFWSLPYKVIRREKNWKKDTGVQPISASQIHGNPQTWKVFRWNKKVLKVHCDKGSHKFPWITCPLKVSHIFFEGNPSLFSAAHVSRSIFWPALIKRGFCFIIRHSQLYARNIFESFSKENSQEPIFYMKISGKRLLR